MIEEIIYYTPDQIRKIRRKIGLTQAKFGKGAGKVTAGTVSRWEGGKMLPTPSRVAVYKHETEMLIGRL